MRLVWGIILLMVGACSSSTSTTGKGEALPPALLRAQEMIGPYYPQAAAMPIVLVENDSGYAAYYNNGKAYVSPSFVSSIDKYGKDGLPILACTIVHEWEHHVQVRTEHGSRWRQIAEKEAYAKSVECLTLLKASPRYIRWYAQQDGLH